jgi:nucleoporin POM152
MVMLTVQVMDSECPGSVITDASTYQVDWVPKPSARLSPDTEVIYQPHNGSHILPPICEGTDDHVDLELAGT